LAAELVTRNVCPNEFVNQPETNQRPHHVRWLHEQLPVWVTKGLVSPTQADAIGQLYPQPKAELPRGMIIFSGLGAVVIGLGVILLLAYNWQTIPKFGKLGLVFGALVTAHAAGLRLFQRTDWRKQLGEALSLLGTMLFGAGIWLVAQVYHINEHYPNGFLLWAAGAVALAWTLRRRRYQGGHRPNVLRAGRLPQSVTMEPNLMKSPVWIVILALLCCVGRSYGQQTALITFDGPVTSDRKQ